jgi:hypothetical protein
MTDQVKTEVLPSLNMEDGSRSIEQNTQIQDGRQQTTSTSPKKTVDAG